MSPMEEDLLTCDNLASHIRLMRRELPICSVSGGKDSTALYCLMVEYFGQNFLPIMADTGHEHPVTLNYVRNLHIMAGGPPVVMVKADFTKQMRMRRHSRTADLRLLTRGTPEYADKLRLARNMRPTGNTFLDMMIWKSAVPTSVAQFCTEHLKLWPIKFYLEENYPRDRFEWVMHNGIRAGESQSRARRQPFEIDTFYDALGVKPLFYEVEETIWKILEAHGVPPNPLYALGNTRVGCFPCIHANKDQLAALPDWAWEKLIWFESVTGLPWFTEPIAKVRDWCRTSHGGRQFNMFRSAPDDAPSCMTDWSICE